MKKTTLIILFTLVLLVNTCFPQLQYNIQNKGTTTYDSKQGKVFNLNLISDSGSYKRIRLNIPKGIYLIKGDRTEKVNKDSNTYSFFVPNKYNKPDFTIVVKQIPFSRCNRTSATVWRAVFKYPIVLTLTTSCICIDIIRLIYTSSHSESNALYCTEQSFNLWRTHRFYRDEMAVYDIKLKRDSSGISIPYIPLTIQDTLVKNAYADSIRAQIKPIVPEMVKVDGGSFYMGDSVGNTNQRPQHKVTLNTFYLSKNLITVAEYYNYCIANGIEMPAPPEWGWNDNQPMVNISYGDALDYCEWLSDKLKKTYRLPTEAEWEYAARGGNKTKGYSFAGSNDLNEVGWYKDNSSGQTNIVEYKKPNELGVYDMSGNVFEWCSDWFGNYNNNAVNNPTGPPSGTEKVMRGGCFDSEAKECKLTSRFSNPPDSSGDGLGFRLVLQE